jgi:hypothetical protein
MKKAYNLVMLATMLVLVTGFASATAVKCGGADLCTWSTSLQGPLPLGSPDNGAGCGLSYNTEWSVNTNAVATCTFNGDNLASALLYISIDNDVIWCTLNGEPVLGLTAHENCAPADPLNGYSIDVTSELGDGTNTLVCEVSDRGIMSHFDACVVGTPVPIVPEFGLVAGMVAVLGALGTFFIIRRK